MRSVSTLVLFFLILLISLPMSACMPIEQPFWVKQDRKAKPMSTSSSEQHMAALQEPASFSTAEHHQISSHRAQSSQIRGVHANSWAFSRGDDSRAAWRNGMPMETLQRRAVENSYSEANNKSVNTASGINSALDVADKRNQAVGDIISVRQETSSWHKDVGPQPDAPPDENLSMERRHVVGAYADVQTDDDLSIKVGPELILKNEEREIPYADDRQPKSSLGVGMQFKLDF